MALTLGFIGLGTMGSRMAARLRAHGYEMAVFNRTQPCGHAAAHGAETDESEHQ